MLFGVLAFGPSTTYTYAELKEMSILQREPVFTLEVDAANTRYFIYINGVSVHKEFSNNGQLTTVLPVNHWMHPAENSVSVEIIPPSSGAPINPSARVKLGLRVHPSGEMHNAQTIATLHFDAAYIDENPTAKSSPSGRFSSTHNFEADDSGDITVSDVVMTPMKNYGGALRFKREMIVPSSLPLWAFFESDDLPDYDAMSDEDYDTAMEDLFVMYEKVQSALARGDIERILPMFNERNEETDKAYYLEPGTTAAGIKEDLMDSIANRELELAPLSTNDVAITRNLTRKVVSLTRRFDTSAIGYNVKGGGSESYNLIFRKENETWILTR